MLLEDRKVPPPLPLALNEQNDIAELEFSVKLIDMAGKQGICN